jgi:nitrous oxidase accessory protein NosD
MSDSHSGKTLLVNPRDASAFATIGSAVQAAAAGDVILVQPGDYHEKLFIDKPISIKGKGEGNRVRIHHTETVVDIAAPLVELDHLCLTGAMTSEAHPVVCVTEGTLRIRACTVRGGITGIRAKADTTLFVRESTVSQSGKYGISLDRCHTAEITDSLIAGCIADGIFAYRSKALIKHSRLSGNRNCGIDILGGDVVLVDNYIVLNSGGDVLREEDPFPF